MKAHVSVDLNQVLPSNIAKQDNDLLGSDSAIVVILNRMSDNNLHRRCLLL